RREQLWRPEQPCHVDARPDRAAAGRPGGPPAVIANADPRLLGRQVPADREMAAELLRRLCGRGHPEQSRAVARPADGRAGCGAWTRLRPTLFGRVRT